MGLDLPEDIRVLSKEFQSHYRSFCEEVIRVSALSSDIERLRSIANENSNADNVVFFRISGPSEQCTTDDDGNKTPVWTPTSYEAGCREGGFSAIEYEGSIFRMQGSAQQDSPEVGTAKTPTVPCQKTIESNAFGFDLSVTENQPCRMPNGIEAQPQILSAGTVVSGIMVGPKTVVFCSNMPRLSADCS